MKKFKINRFYHITLLLITPFVTLICTELVIQIIVAFSPDNSFFTRLKETINQAESAMSQSTQTIYQLDNDLLFTHKPHASGSWSSDEITETRVINSFGIRDIEYGKKKPETYRIVMVGDSFTYGHGISSNEKTYPKITEQILKCLDYYNGGVEVLNAGVAGYTPDQEYRYITHQIIAWDPDLIVWNITEPNDLHDLTLDEKWPFPALYGLSNDKLIPYNARLNWFYVRNFLVTNASLLKRSYIFNLFFDFMSRYPFFSGKPNLPADKLITWGSKKLLIEIEEVFKILKEKHIEFRIVFLPTKESLGLISGWEKYKQPFIKLRELLKIKGIPYTDVKEILTMKDTVKEFTRQCNPIPKDFFSAQDAISKLYFSSDIHPNENGAKIFAQIVADRLNSSFNSNNLDD